MLKLDKECKALRKEMLAALPAYSTMAMSECGFTVLMVPHESVDYIATSVASYEDRKENGPNRKVGEFHALCRYEQGEAVPVPQDFSSASVILERLGYVVKPFKNGDLERVTGD